MAEKTPLYTVTDKRKFTTAGELREGRPAEPDPAPPAPPVAEPGPAGNFATPETASSTGGPGLHLVGAEGKVEDGPVDEQEEGSYATQSRTAAGPESTQFNEPATGEDANEDDGLGPEPTAAETAQQKEDYQRSSDLIDTMVKQANPAAPPAVEMDFEQLVQSIYLSAIVAMGAGGEPGQKPRLDIIGARHSIDMLAVLGDKTKGNLTAQEQRLLQSALFNLRMMFLEITNALAASAQRPPVPPVARK
jgi:hypothetical protein